MAPGGTIVGLVFVLTGGLLLLLLREPIRQPGKPASRWFALAVVGISLWPIGLGMSYLLADLELSLLAYNGRAVAAALISVSWFLLAVEYTTRRPPSRLLLVTLGGYLLFDVTLTWTNGFHHLLLTEGTVQVGTVLIPEYGPWFWARTVFNYGLIVLATALLAVEWNDSSGLQRRQAAILAVAVVPPVIANLLTLIAAVPSIYDLTPFGLAGSGILLTWALYRVEFLDVVPVARETAMEETRDAVVTLDDENRVVDCNAAARDLFSVDDGFVRTPAEAFFDGVPGEVLDHVADADGTTVTIDFGVDREPVSHRPDAAAVGDADG